MIYRPYLIMALTHSLTPYSTVLLEKLTGFQLVKKFPAFYGTRKFITAFTSARHLSLSWTSSIPSTPAHPTSWRSILILSSHQRLGLPSGLFPLGFPTKTLYTPLFSPISATCPAHLIILGWKISTCHKIRGIYMRNYRVRKKACDPRTLPIAEADSWFVGRGMETGRCA